MERLFNENCDVEQLSPLTLAFIGDAVYDLFVREKLVCEANRPIKKLHTLAVGQVRASAQADAVQKLMPILSESEIAFLKRGRNAHVHHLPKNGNPRDYHFATALETLFGYLYMKGETQRLRELFNAISKEDSDEEAVAQSR